MDEWTREAMIVPQSLAVALLVAAVPAAAAAAAQGRLAERQAANAGSAATPPSQLASVTRRTPLTHFGARPVLELRGSSGSETLDFGMRADELVTRATLRVRYAYSPALVPVQSHVRLALNDEVVGLLPVAPDGAGRTVEHAVEVDPRLFVGQNRLVLTLVAQRAAGMEDPARPGLWADVSGGSELEISTRPLLVADDLALLPEPFFDRRDQRRLALPFAFGAQPSLPTLRAAAVVASWFGQLAGWRGARFPALLNTPPEGHAIVFATNAERPSFLGALPPVAGPQLRVMTNPADGQSKLLLVLGRDGNDLKAAADALVLGHVALSGAVAQVKDVQQKAPRPAYDAPGWVRLDRAMKLGELIDWPQQLQASGRPPQLDPIRVNLRIPPDLAAWRGPGVPMALKYHFTPPACAGESHLDVNINDELLQVVALRPSAGGGEATPSRPALPAAVSGSSEVLIPAYRLRARSQLQFGFRFAMREDGGCAGASAGAVRAVVDAGSSIDFSGFPHYAPMPNLGHFVSVGFPFTKYADLSQTVVALPERPSAADIEALLGLMGRMGESTGSPATGVRVADARDKGLLADADLLVIGAWPQQALLGEWSDRLPVALSGPSRQVSQPVRRVAAVYEWLGLGGQPDADVAVRVSLEGDGPLSALLGFESPVTSGRSVVAITAAAPERFSRILDAMDDPETRRSMRGSAVLVHANKVESLRVGPGYSIGFLPPWAGSGYWLSDRPWLLALLAAVSLSILAYAAWRANRAVAAWRIRRRT